MIKSGLKLGFIGLGIMGAPMAGHLLKAGHMLFVNTVGNVPPELADGGVTICTTAQGVAERADIIFIMVPDTPDVEKVLFGENGVGAGLKGSDNAPAGRGKTVVDMSSIDPIATRGFAEKIKAASLTIMVGGEPQAFERIKPLFDLMGKNVTLVGSAGDGQVCKVANQIIVALNIAAVGEALVFASKAGADPARVREALMGGFASSRILEVHGERMIKRTFAPGFRIALHQKDLNLALQGARALGVALPQTAIAAQLMQSCVALGHGQADHSALVRALENMAQHPVAPDA